MGGLFDDYDSRGTNSGPLVCPPTRAFRFRHRLQFARLEFGAVRGDQGSVAFSRTLIFNWIATLPFSAPADAGLIGSPPRRLGPHGDNKV